MRLRAHCSATTRKLVFDYVVSSHDSPTSALAVTGINVFGSNIEDLAGNHADLGHVSGNLQRP